MEQGTWLPVVLAVAAILFSGCHADESANQLLLFSDVPDNMIGGPHEDYHLILRNNFKGSVEFIESDEFHIEVNITSPNHEELATIKYNYTYFEGSILLQLFSVPPEVVESPLGLILVTIGAGAVIAFVCSIIFVCWWNIKKKPYVQNKSINPDSVQAPLLDAQGAAGQTQSTPTQQQTGPNKLRKRKKKRPNNHHLAGGAGGTGSEEYASSEEDTMTRSNKNLPPPGGYMTTTMQQQQQQQQQQQLNCDDLPPPPPMEPPNGSCSELDGQSTLKIRPSPGPTPPSNISDYDTVPRGAPVRYVPPPQGYPAGHPGGGHPGAGHPGAHPGGHPGYPHGQADTLNRRYVPLRDPDGGSSAAVSMASTLPRGMGGGPQGYYTPPGGQYSGGESDYGTAEARAKTLSGAQIAHILADRNKASPKSAYTHDRPPVTFGSAKDQHDLEQVDLDSVGSSRSAGSSRTSGTGTQSYSESVRSERGPPLYTDSDSARSSASTGARSKDGSTYGASKYFMSSPLSSTESDTGPRHGGGGQGGMNVDEAYGTMGSNNGSATLRSCSTASTGSGSSGSVITVINNDPNGRGRDANRYHKGPQGYPPGVAATTLERRGQGGGGGGGGSLSRNAPMYLHNHLMLASIVTCLCLGTGVYSLLQQHNNTTEVKIRVYAPPGFLRSTPHVYVRRDVDVNVTDSFKTQNLHMHRYDVADTYYRNLDENRCGTLACRQGCDPNTGECVCNHGYYLLDNKFECRDVDECKTDPHPCHQKAECYNIEGSYRCICTDGYYGDGKYCEACTSPCQNGTYEETPCGESRPKMCKQCLASCMDGYYVSAPCTPTHNTECKGCNELCKRGFYEYSPCAATVNRKCRDIDALPKPMLSKNLIWENRRDVIRIASYVLRQDEASGPLTHMMNLKRGTGFAVHITLKESNLAPLYRPVNHQDSNDNPGFPGDKDIIRNYCAYPVPEKYELKAAVHQGVTTKAQYYSCDKQKKSLSDTPSTEWKQCEGETGYYLNPDEPCHTYSQFGRLPDLDSKGGSVLCTKPGVLSQTMGVSSELGDLTTMFVDKTVSCAEQRTNCDSCTRTCARNMQSYRGSHRCNITGEDSDNGESPRLQYCYSCCNKEDCSKTCEVYHNPACEQLRCVTGNLAEFVLTPTFSHRDKMFACHIEPVPKYKIYELEYTALNNGAPVNSRRLTARKLYEGVHPAKATAHHDFLTVNYGSEVHGIPDLVEGDIGLKHFSAGYYQAEGQQVSTSGRKDREMTVRPKKPFAVSTESWKRENCDTNALDDLVLAESDPYRPDPHVTVQYVTGGQYRLFNQSSAYHPHIYFEIPVTESVLKPMYDPASVKDDETLKAELIREARKFTLNISGELDNCPGYFELKVYDPLYPTDPLYHLDVGVDCPKAFNLEFAIPMEGGYDVYDKRMIAEVKDSYRTIKMTVLRPKPVMSKETMDSPVKYEAKGESKMTIFTPFIAVLGVVISFLLLLLLFGFITQTGRSMKKTDNKVHSQHLLFVVCYVTFRTAYSLAITFTVLLLMMRYVNRDSTTALSEFGRYSDTAENNQKIEIKKIQDFVITELERQNQLANETKYACEKKLLNLQSMLEETKQKMKVENQDERLVSQVALQYTRRMIMNLTDSINTFKDEFSKYAKKAVEKLTRSIVQTSSALQENKWLAGAEVIYKVVDAKRKAQGQSTKPFMEWVGIQQEVDRLYADLSLKDFPMPNLTELMNLEMPKINTKHSSIPKISDITLPRNQWYYQYEKKPTPSPPGGQNGKQSSSRLRPLHVVSWTVLLAVLVVIDVLWFVHRMARTYSTAKMVLYGCPAYIDCKKSIVAENVQRGIAPPPAAKRSVTSRCCSFLKDLNLRVMKTEFVPKLVATATVCCGVYLVLAVSDKLLTVKTMAAVGYFDSLVAPVETSYQLARTRVATNAQRINKFEFPFYERLVNVRTKRYQLMLEMYANLQRSNNVLHDSEYCSWAQLLQKFTDGSGSEKPVNCNCTTATAAKLQFSGCELPPVSPQAYHNRKDFGIYREKLARSIVVYLNHARQIVMDTCHLVVIFVAILVLVDCLGAVIWIYFKRFNLLRLKPMFEIEQYPTPEVNHT